MLLRRMVYSRKKSAYRNILLNRGVIVFTHMTETITHMDWGILERDEQVYIRYLDKEGRGGGGVLMNSAWL